MFALGLGMFLLTTSLSGAPPPRVAYTIEEVPGSWQPLEPADIAKTIEHAALEVLSKPGLIQLEKTNKRAAETQADYLLTIEGRTVDEAETHTVYLTFGPAVRTDIASFGASESVALGKQAKAAMLTAIEGSARKAAAQLLAVLKPQLELARGGGSGQTPKDPADGKELPWKWPDVQVPRATSGRASTELYSKKSDERHAALRELTSLALTEASPRNVLEACVQKHPDKEMRLGCLVALRPLSRRTEPTQRVVIEAFRRDDDSQIKNEANEQMIYFTGLARQEAVQAWLESLAKCETSGPIDELGDIANLDIAIKSCLINCGKKPKYQRSKRSCIEALKPVPLERRRRILWRSVSEFDPDSPYYVEGAGASEGSTGTDWQWAAEALLEGATKWDPELEEILWKRYQRTLSSSALDMLGDYAPASQKMVDRMIEVLQTAGEREALPALRRIGKEKADLRPQIREKLSELLVTGNYAKSVSKHDLESAIKELAEPAEKKQ